MTTLYKNALDLLKANTLTAKHQGQTYQFTVPTSDEGVNKYRIPKLQWTGWDSQFHAIAYMALGETKRAYAELESILINQRPDGLIPHVAFWDAKNLPLWAFLESRGRFSQLPGFSKPKTTEHIQPPLYAQAIERLWISSNNDLAIIKRFLGPVTNHYRWLAENRDPDNDGLISVISQAETGLDYSPAYDALLGYEKGGSAKELRNASRKIRARNKYIFNYNLPHIFKYSDNHMEDVLVNSVYIQGLRALERLANVARETSIATWAQTTHQNAYQSLLEKCYDPEVGLFFNLIGKNEHRVSVRTVGSLMPMILENLPKDIIKNLMGHLLDPKEFWTKYPIPSTALSEPAFSADSRLDGELRIWRGPLSMNTNWLITTALRKHGYSDIANDISEKSKKLVEKYSFNEFYNPLTGEPCGADKFGWATLVVDL